MLPKILKFGFIFVVIFVVLLTLSPKKLAYADSCSTQNIGGTWYYICSNGCVSGQQSRWYYYWYWNGSTWVWVGWYTVPDSSCSPPPPPCKTVYCTDPTGFTSSGAGGSCSFSGQTSTAQSCTYICPDQSRVAGHYNSICSYDTSSQQYCYGSDCSCQPNSPCPTPTPPPCKTVYCTDTTGVTSSGAGGQCSFNGQTSTAQSCTYQCTYPFGPSQNVPGHYTSTCSYDSTAQKYCYGSSCTCAPNNPCPPCPTITCNGANNAGGTCSSSGQTSDVGRNGTAGSCTFICPVSKKPVAGHTISVCQSNLCYYNDCTCYADDPNACNNGSNKTVETCNNGGNWVQQSQACVQSATCPQGATIATPTPTPTPPPCNTTSSSNDCTACSGSCSNNNSNAKTCTLTRRTDGLACTPVTGLVCGQNGNPCPDGSGCAQNCPNNFNCVSLSCQPSLSISGNVFVDVNVNTLKDAGETNYTGAATFQLNTGATSNAANGAYTFPQLLAGTYMMSYTNPPTGAGGFSMTVPLNGPPPSWSVSVGSGSCSVGGSPDGSCDASGSVINLNFGITNNKPWIQCKGADCRIDAGFTSEVPSTAIGGAYANLNGSGGTPGLIFTGNATPNFGQGQASTTNWIVGGPTYGELYAPIRIGGIVKTSYNYVSAKASAGNITPTDLAPHCSGGLANCTLTFGANSHGVYRANGDVTLNAFTFPAGQNFVILVNGNLTIRGKILVPNGSTALFSASRNINIDKTLGEVASSTTPTIEGIYSADRSFVVQGYGGCTVQADLRFNVAGSIIANAALAGGSFQNQRDLCANDIYYPTIYFTERLDMVLNTPDFLKAPNFTYQEIAP